MNNKKPGLGIRILLHAASFLLCVILMSGLLVTAALIDLKTVTSAKGIETVINILFAADKPTQDNSSLSFYGSKDKKLNSTGPVMLSASNGDFEIPDDFEIPYEALVDADALADFVVEMINEYADESVDITRETALDFIKNSTITEYTSQKVSGYLQDALEGTEDTVITTDEIMTLLEDNKQLIEQTFDVTVTDEMTDKIRSNVAVVIDENDLNGNIRREIDNAMQQPLEGTDMTVSDVAGYFGRLIDIKTILLALCICLLLTALLFLTNYYKPVNGLTWASVPFIAAGIISIGLTAAVCAVVQYNAADYAGLISDLTALFAPIHYGIAIVGVLMLTASVVWRVLNKKRVFEKMQIITQDSDIANPCG